MNSSPSSDTGLDLDASRLAAIISPLRRALLATGRAAASLPEISDAQIEVVRALPEGTSLQPSEIAARLRLDRSTVSNLLRTMEQNGLIEREPVPGDGRRTAISASPRATELFRTFDRVSAGILARAATHLTPEETAALAAALPALEHLTALVKENPAP